MLGILWGIGVLSILIGILGVFLANTFIPYNEKVLFALFTFTIVMGEVPLLVTVSVVLKKVFVDILGDIFINYIL